MSMLENWIKRAHALIDGSAWLLIAPAFALLYWLDAPLAKTFATWSLYFLVLAGVAVIISRIVFPQIHLGEFSRRAYNGGLASAIVTAAIVLFVAALIIAGVLWGKPA